MTGAGNWPQSRRPPTDTWTFFVCCVLIHAAIREPRTTGLFVTLLLINRWKLLCSSYRICVSNPTMMAEMWFVTYCVR